MDDKSLKKISKKELLEILLAQARRIEELEEELLVTKEKLDSKKITIMESGSIAEASLKLNEIFEVAQKSIDQYKYNVIKNCQELEEKTEEKCKKLKDEAEALYSKNKKKHKNKTDSDNSSSIKDKVKKRNNKKRSMSVKSKKKT